MAMKLGDLDAWWEDRTIPEQRRILRQHIDRVVIHPAKRRGGNVFDPDRVEIIETTTA